MLKVKLNNGTFMPIIGLGTFRNTDKTAYNAVKTAIDAGYRHIDTASIYGNEEAIGKAINDSNIKREELFITTKVWNTDQGYNETLKAFNVSLKKLNLDYVDLYLVHWFKGYNNSISTYKALEELYLEGKVKAIGVSNYNIHHLEHLLKNCKIKPMVNQVETHIFLQNHFLQEYCQQNEIQLEAYAPLVSTNIQDLLENETMKKIAKKHHKTVPQIAIRWFVQRKIVVIPKSKNPKRLKENISVFDFKLDKEDMNNIRKLNVGKKYFPEFDNVEF